MTIKLYYFDFAGRGEPIRLIFAYGGVAFEDMRVSKEEWEEIKPQTPFGQAPVLNVDGVWLAQSHALERYAAAVAGLLPSDPLSVALAEQALFLMEDALQLFIPTFKLVELEAKIAARQELLKGAYGDKLAQLAKLLEGKKFLLGDEVMYVDLAIFASLSLVKSGFMEGIPGTLLDSYPALKEFHTRVASLDKVKAYYKEKTGTYAAFQPSEE